MIWKSLLEEWPIEHDTVWLRYTKDGINYIEEVIHERSIHAVKCLGVAEWRSIEPPAWVEDI